MKKRRKCRMCGKMYYATKANQKLCSSFCRAVDQQVYARKYLEKQKAKRAKEKKHVERDKHCLERMHYHGKEGCSYARSKDAREALLTKDLDQVTCKNCLGNMKRITDMKLGKPDYSHFEQPMEDRI